MSRFVERVLARLEEAESSEPDVWLRDDLRIARLTLLHAARGDAVECSPHVLASYEVLGLHPEKVWPAICARRSALGADVWEAPPKKPAQSVTLWCEKNERRKRLWSLAPGNTLLRDNTNSVPMAAPSIAALYRNSDVPSSANSRQYNLRQLKEIVGYSGAPDSICALTLSALRARGEWPNQSGPATTVISVAILGMMFEGVCCRSTVQRRIKRAVNLGYWRRVQDANSWTNCPKCGKARQAAKCGACDYRGRSKDDKGNWTGEFMRVPTYDFDVEKFRTARRCREIRHFDARTYQEYKEAAKRGEHPNVTEMPARKPANPAPDTDSPPPAKAAPQPQRERPAAEHRAERAQETRSEQRARALHAGVLAEMSKLMSDGLQEEEAVRKVCSTWGVRAEQVRAILKDCLFEPPEAAPKADLTAMGYYRCEKCGANLVQNFGPGPRLVCPKCAKSP